MSILIDPPLWPAHGTLWSHLVSDTDYGELHAFAKRLRLPRRSFDLDHYDVPASLHAQAIALGARPVGPRDVVHRLRDSGLRVRRVERETIRPIRRREYLLAEWAGLGALVGMDGSIRLSDAWRELGTDLLARWNEPHRTYHDERHLEEVLLALDHLGTRGAPVSPAALIAAWFHDAVYTGSAGADERDSAALAEESLGLLGIDPALVRQVSGLVIATEPGLAHAHASEPLAHLLDADLAIFASSESRYREYTTSVRSEYARVPEAEFRDGRAGILLGYLLRPTIYLSEASRLLWEERARANLTREVGELLSVPE